MATTTKAAKSTAPKARTCGWRINGETRCGQPLVRPSAATCRDHVEAWMEKRGRKLTMFSAMTVAEIAKAKEARPRPATKAPARKATKPAPRKVLAKAKAETTGTTMEKEIAAVKAIKEREAERRGDRMN
jgi:hypothetical protein